MSDEMPDRRFELPGTGWITAPPYLDREIGDRVLVLADWFARAEDAQPPVATVTAIEDPAPPVQHSADDAAGDSADGLERVVHVQITGDLDDQGRPVKRSFPARELCLIDRPHRPGTGPGAGPALDGERDETWEQYQARRAWVLDTYSVDLLLGWEAYEVRTDAQLARDHDGERHDGERHDERDAAEIWEDEATGGTGGWIERTLAVVPEVSALDALQANRQLVDWLTLRRWYVIRDAREAGASWTEIGTALGVTKQGAHDWYRRTIATIDADAATHNAHSSGRYRWNHDTSRAERALRPDPDATEMQREP